MLYNYLGHLFLLLNVKTFGSSHLATCKFAWYSKNLDLVRSFNITILATWFESIRLHVTLKQPES